MRLRSLQIKGFKSFANDTILNFEEDVIGVVGPNGSGKSNIVDAIRWVLGEQKGRELRLDNMSDVIFNGTKTRKEAGVAQVSLTFDNTKNILPTDYQSVTISRLLYRSGESEYRLNNIQCRLKDIRSLFIDTGIGSNSYAIIALGMVDDILADKDNARRRMFEQASGISKYKTRKRETLLKLKSTSEDLDRIEDLLFEIDNNLKMLEKQARRTKKYFELKEQYRTLSIQYALRSISTLKDQYKTVKEKLSKEEAIYREIDVQLKKEESELQSIKGNNLHQEENLSEQQRDLNDLVNRIRSDENRKSLAIQRMGFKQEEITKVYSANERFASTVKNTETEIKRIQTLLESENLKLHEIEKEAKEAQDAYEVKQKEYDDIRSKMDAYSRNKERLSMIIFETEKSLAVTQNQIENVGLELKKSIADIEELKSSTLESESDYVASQKEVESLEKEVALKEEIIEKKKKEIQSAEEQLSEVKDKLSAFYRKRDAITNERDLLKSMIDNHEGYPESIKFLSKKWKNKIPVLSDILDVEDQYKAIIEQYLEGFLNYFIVPSRKEAFEAIQLLTDAQKGKANFFLLDQFNEKVRSSSGPDNTIPAIQVVNIDDQYKLILERLLEGVFIHMGNLNEIEHQSLDEGVTVLDGSGKIILKAKEIRGGSVGLFEGKKIGRKKNLEKLNKAIIKIEKDIDLLKHKSDRLLESIKIAKSEDVTDNLHEVRQHLARAKEHHFQVQYKRENTSRRMAQLEASKHAQIEKKSQLEEKITEYLCIIDSKKKELDNLTNGRLFSDSEIDELNHTLNLSREKFNRLNILHIRQQNHVENIHKDINLKSQKRDDLLNDITQNDDVLKRSKKEIEDLTQEINQLEKSLSERYILRDEKRSLLNEAEKEYYSARNIINEKEDEVRKLNRSLNQAQVHINLYKDDYNEIKFKISGVSERLKIEFDIILNDIINDEVDESMPYEDLEQKVDRLKTRLGNFGEINPMAVTAYDEMKDRYDTIQCQREDILEAKNSLLQTIDEIETTATEKYLNAFSQVRENFINVFRSLFTEDDTCDLILLDPEQPLDSAIEIIAKPKGKKPKSLNQLSGGEKTLTATALLFALYLLKPAPFCIFDEVDAPLDDANIQKFNKIINKFSDDSQFIIVTHNKSTMAAVDVLYGVYMQEQGVSGVTPVDFRNYEHQPIIEAINN
jgi:chromosome segregation protein